MPAITAAGIIIVVSEMNFIVALQDRAGWCSLLLNWKLSLCFYAQAVKGVSPKTSVEGKTNCQGSVLPVVINKTCNTHCFPGAAELYAM
jgi:hypothetical protein